jgi:hypothetical protein
MLMKSRQRAGSEQAKRRKRAGMRAGREKAAEGRLMKSRQRAGIPHVESRQRALQELIENW